VYALSIIIAVLMAVASITGVLYRVRVYPTDDLLQSFVPNGLVNLLVGLLLWPGALFFVLYNYLIYVLAMPLNAAFPMHLTLLILSTYTLVGLIASMDGAAIQWRLSGSVPERGAGAVLAGLGLLFFLRVVGVLVSMLVSETQVTETELAAHVADYLIAPALAIGGVLLWRHIQFGYVTGLGLLFQASMLFIGLIAFLLVQPILTAAPFVLSDVMVILVLGLIYFVPFAQFVRPTVSGLGSPSI
jgi:hypothetical protein